MKIYIPPHFDSIEIFKQASDLINGYADYFIDNSSSFDDYNYDLTNDPVKKFLNLCISPTSIVEPQTYEEVINYVSELFYSVKGTVKIFEYMKNYLNLEFDGDITYTTDFVEFKLIKVTQSNLNLFYQSLEEFLNTLLFFQSFKVEVEDADLVLEGNIPTQLSPSIRCYSEIVLTVDDIQPITTKSKKISQSKTTAIKN